MRSIAERELKLKVRSVVIIDSLVHKIIGLPLGEHDIELRQGRVGRTTWDERYPTYLISPIIYGQGQDTTKQEG